MNYRCPMCASTNLIARGVKSFDPHSGDDFSWIENTHALCDCKECGHTDSVEEFDADAVGYATLEVAA